MDRLRQYGAVAIPLVLLSGVGLVMTEDQWSWGDTFVWVGIGAIVVSGIWQGVYARNKDKALVKSVETEAKDRLTVLSRWNQTLLDRSGHRPVSPMGDGRQARVLIPRPVDPTNCQIRSARCCLRLRTGQGSPGTSTTFVLCTGWNSLPRRSRSGCHGGACGDLGKRASDSSRQTWVKPERARTTTAALIAFRCASERKATPSRLSRRPPTKVKRSELCDEALTETQIGFGGGHVAAPQPA